MWMARSNPAVAGVFAMARRPLVRTRKWYWVPGTCRELRQALRKMGVKRISGKPLSMVKKRQLYAVYFEMRERGDNDRTREQP
jgi:hypothetical protein